MSIKATNKKNSDNSLLDLNKESLIDNANSENDWLKIQDQYEKHIELEIKISEERKKLHKTVNDLIDQRINLIDIINSLENKIYHEDYIKKINSSIFEKEPNLKLLQKEIDSLQNKYDLTTDVFNNLLDFIHSKGGKTKVAPELLSKQKDFEKKLDELSINIKELHKQEKILSSELLDLHQIVNQYDNDKSQLIELEKNLQSIESISINTLDEIGNKISIFPIKEIISTQNKFKDSIISLFIKNINSIKLAKTDEKKELINELAKILLNNIWQSKKIYQIKNIHEYQDQLEFIVNALISGVKLSDTASTINHIKKIEEDSVRFVEVEKRGRYYEFVHLLIIGNIFKFVVRGNFSWPIKRLINLGFSSKKGPLIISNNHEKEKKVANNSNLSAEEKEIRQSIIDEINIFLPIINKLLAYLDVESDKPNKKIFADHIFDYQQVFENTAESLVNILDEWDYAVEIHSPIYPKSWQKRSDCQTKIIKINKIYNINKNEALKILNNFQSKLEVESNKNIKSIQMQINELLTKIDNKEKKVCDLENQVNNYIELLHKYENGEKQMSLVIDNIINQKNIVEKDKQISSKKILGSFQTKKYDLQISNFNAEIESNQLKINDLRKENKILAEKIQQSNKLKSQIIMEIEEINNQINFLKEKISKIKL